MEEGKITIATAVDLSGFKSGLAKFKSLAASSADEVEKELKDIDVDFGDAAEDAADGIRDIGGAAEKTGKQSQSLGSSLEGLVGQIGGASLAVTAGKKAFDLFAQILKESISASISFESAITGVYKTVDASDAVLAQITNDIKEMATTLPATTTEIAGVAEAAGQLGIAAEDIVSFTEVMINLGEATNLGAEEAASALAKFANITKMNASDYERLGSTIVDLGNNFATTEADIVGMATRLASTAAVAGLTEAEMMALAAALSSVGMEADAGGTAISKLIKEMQGAAESGGKAREVLLGTGYSLRELEMLSDKSADDFKGLAHDLGYTSQELKNMLSQAQNLEKFAEVAGMTADAFSKLWASSPIEAMGAFIDGLGQISASGGDALGILNELGFTEVRLSNAVLSLASSEGVLNEALNVANAAWEENVALSNEAEKRYETLESKIGKLKNSIEVVKIGIGDMFSEDLKSAADIGITIFSFLSEQIEKSGESIRKVLQILALASPGTMLLGMAGWGLDALGAFDRTQGKGIGLPVGTTVPEGTTPTTSISVEEMIAQEQAAAAAAMETQQAVAAASQSMMQAVNEALEAGTSLDEKLEATGRTTEDLANMMVEFGQQAADAFGKLDTGADSVITLDQMMANLTANQEAMRAWGDNMDSLAQRMRDFEGGQYVVEQFRQMGIEGAAQLQQLMNATDEELAALAAKVQEGLKLSVEVGLEVSGGDLTTQFEEQLAPIQAQLEGYKKLFEGGLISQEQFEGLTAPLLEEFNAVQEEAGAASAAVSAEMAAATAAGQAAAAEAGSIGTAMVDGIASGIAASGSGIADALVAAVNDGIAAAKDAAEIHSPSRLTKRTIGKPLIQGIGSGIVEDGKRAAEDMKMVLKYIIRTGEMETRELIDNARAPAYSGRENSTIGHLISSSNSYDQRYNQVVNFYTPVESPSAVARKIKEIQKSVALNF